MDEVGGDKGRMWGGGGGGGGGTAAPCGETLSGCGECGGEKTSSAGAVEMDGAGERLTMV